MAGDLRNRLFWIAKEDEVKAAETTDVYFLYTLEVMKKSGVDPTVVMEVYARGVPYPEGWGVVTGIYEAVKLLEGLPVDVYAMDEGEVFLTSKDSPVYEPVFQIIGKYTSFAVYENPLLGFLCSSSGVSTKAARVRLAAKDRVIFSFGTRRVHPALAPMVERAAYIAGFDSVSNVLGAKLMGKKAVGTMPHALILCFGSQVEAWKAFDRSLPGYIPRIALVDTLSDEKTEAIMALEALGEKLYGVRIDTPSSRRGNWRKIIEEVRWELNVRGAYNVKIFASGGLDEKIVGELVDLVDGFGVGTSVAGAPPIDFSAKIVSIIDDGKEVPRAKRGDLGGRKQVYRDWERFEDVVTLASKEPPSRDYKPLLKPIVKQGKIVKELKSVDELRKEVLERLRRLKDAKPRVRWLV